MILLRMRWDKLRLRRGGRNGHAVSIIVNGCVKLHRENRGTWAVLYEKG